MRFVWTGMTLLFVFSLLSVPAQGIVIRHDREDKEYRKLGENHPNVGSFVPVGNGACTLIHPRWVITAAHVGAGVSPFHRTIRFGDQDYLVERVVLHPTWGGGESLKTIDMALLKLASPVTGIKPAKLYQKTDEVGKTVLFVGWGDTGNGKTGPQERDEVLRGATNEVDSEKGGWMTFLFDAPPAGTPNEGISGPGDSGGPAFIEEGGTYFIAGVSASNEPASEGDGPCRYGSREYYPRISKAYDWIVGTMKEEPGSQAVWGKYTVDLGEADWPETLTGEIAEAFFLAVGSGDPEDLVNFEEKYRSSPLLEETSAGKRARTWRRRKREWGALEPHSYAIVGETEIWVLVNARRSHRWMTMRFVLDGQKLPGLERVDVGRARKP